MARTLRRGRRARATRSKKADSRNPAVDAALHGASATAAVPLQWIAGGSHYEQVLGAVLGAQFSVCIATANVKGLFVEGAAAAPGSRRTVNRARYQPVVAALAQLARRGVELKLLHAELPSGPFRRELQQHPELLGAGLELRRCPRVHAKLVVVDASLLYLGSANWTGAGLGARGNDKRNFELGITTRDDATIDRASAWFDHVWNGRACGTCALRAECPGPLDQLNTAQVGAGQAGAGQAGSGPVRSGPARSGPARQGRSGRRRR